MKKRVLAAFLAVWMVISMVPATAFAATEDSGSCGYGVYYSLSSDGVLTISGSGYMSDYYDYGGKRAPWNYKTVTTLIIEEGVKSVGEYAFCNMNKITSVSLPSTLTTIGAYAFESCKGITEIVIPESVYQVGEKAFQYCYDLESVTLHGNLYSIGKYAFEGCNSLTELEIPEGITSIDQYAFYGLSNLEKLTIPGTVKTIGAYAFAFSNLTKLQIPEGVTTIKNNAFHYADLTDLELPASLTSIGEEAFKASGYSSKNKLERIYYYGTEEQWAALTDKTDLEKAELIYLNAGECSHMYAYDLEAVTENCTEDGLTAGRFCPMCQTAYEPQEVIPATGHSWTEWVITLEPTLTSAGSKSHTCTVCKVEETEEIQPLMNPFTDVEDDDFFYNAVLWAYNRGVTTGSTETLFEPSVSCTRAQVVTFLWRAAGCPEPETTECPFVDVKEGKWYYKAVLWAAEKGITTGTSATTFSPDDTIIREQFVTFLWRAAGKPDVSGRRPFSDLESDDYFYEAVVWATQNGYCTGVGKDRFAPSDSCTRGQTVTFMHRYYADCPVTAPSAIGLSSRFMWLADFRATGFTLEGTVYPNAAEGENITWTSMDPSVATISENGKVSRVGTGKTTIEAKCGKAVSYCTVQVPDVDMGWYVYSTAQDLDSMILDYHTNPYACTYVDRNGDLCVVVVIFIKYLTVGGFWNEDFYTVSYNTNTGRAIKDPAKYYDAEAERYWGQSKIHYMEMSSDYMKLEIQYQKMTEYYQKGLELGIEDYWVPVG